MDENQPHKEIGHGHIMVAIGQIEITIGHLGRAIEELNINHKEQIRRWEDHQRTSDQRHNRTEQQLAQVVILAVVASIFVPIMVNALDPRVQFGQPHHTEERR